MGSFGAADADIGSWAQIRDAAQRIIGDCVEGSASRYPGLGGINRYLGMSRDFLADSTLGDSQTWAIKARTRKFYRV